MTITQKALKLIKNISVIGMILPMIAFSAESISNPANKKITLRLALTKEEHGRGLSGLKPKDFSDKEGMLFVNEGMGTRRFWMPDTYFNLDIIFLDSALKIVGIEKNVPFHPTSIEPPVIFRTKTYEAQFVLETKANSPFSKGLKVGDQLKWLGPTPISEIVLRTHPKQ